MAALCVWEAACRLLKLPEYIIPAPSAIFQAAREMGLARWLEHLRATLEVALLGYLAAIALALPLAVAITRSPASAKASAVARPMPLEHPVMRTVLMPLTGSAAW